MEGHDLSATHLCRFRRTPVVNVLLGDTLPRPDRSPAERERWARAMMIFFKPWRSLDDLKNLGETWADAYDSTEFTYQALQIIQNMNVENQCKDARDAHEVLRK
ncbi:hypothetical protein C8R44DRAFT_650818, partial [Mycena epipterygia]